MFLPTDEQFYSAADPTKPDIAFLKNHFYREGRLTEEQALFILSRCVRRFSRRRLTERRRHRWCASTTGRVFKRPPLSGLIRPSKSDLAAGYNTPR